MPIDVETFQSDLDERPTHAGRIVRFLAANGDEAFERGDVDPATDAPATTVGSATASWIETG